jgi:hypothetical protein
MLSAHRDEGFDKLSPNGVSEPERGERMSAIDPVRTELVEVLVAYREEGFDKLSPNGVSEPRAG